MVRLDVKFVECPTRGAGDEAFPNPGGAARSQEMRFGIPSIETANHRDRARVGCPHAENSPALAVVGRQVSSHFVVKAVVAALVEQVEIVLGEELRPSGRERGIGGHSNLISLPERRLRCHCVVKPPAPALDSPRARAILTGPAMPSLRVILLWHQHQPFYKDLVTGEYRLPWVRLHALKDYYGMVKLLDEFPNVHQNFNIVPSLMVQIQDYAAGTAQDPFLSVAAKPAKDLTTTERRFALQYLFQANPVHMIGRYPRYQALWERFRSAGDSPERAERYFQAQDFTDLQVLSQIAWFDEFFLEDPEIAALIKKGNGYSLEDQAFIIARQRELVG